MHRVLNIAEILRSIFGFLRKGSNARNARVCKAWSSIALDDIWAEVEPDIFRSLCPMDAVGRRDAHDVLAFTRPLLVDDWTRFLKNSGRVQEWVDSAYSAPFRLSRDAMNDIAITRPLAPIFPNLRHISVGTAQFELFFMETSLQSLELLISGDSNNHSFRTPWLLKNVGDRFSGLTSLILGYEPEAPNYDEPIIDLLRNLTQLQEVTLPIMCVNASIVLALANHQSLRKVLYDDATPIVLYKCTEHSRFLFDCAQPLPSGAFPSLESMSFSAVNIEDATSFLFQPGFPSQNLFATTIHLRSHPSSRDVAVFFRRLVTERPALVNLNLICHGLRYTDASELRSIPLLHLEDLRPFSQFRNIVTLGIRLPYPIDLTDEKIEELAPVWPALEVLRLCPHPIVPAPTKLSLAALAPLIRHCSRLNYLGLYVDGSLPISLPSTTPHPQPTNSYSTSLCLQIGYSPLPVGHSAIMKSYPKIAQYLTSISSNAYDWDWDDSAFVAETPDRDEWLPNLTEHCDIDGYEQGWKIVAAMTKMLFEERNRLLRSDVGNVGVGHDACERRYATLGAKYAGVEEKVEALSARAE